MFAVLRVRVCAAFSRVLTSARTMLREAFRPAPVVQGFVQDLLRSPQELIAENVALRQQLVVVARSVKRLNFTPLDRGLLVALTSILPRWRDALLLVTPETVLRWHRQGFRMFWKEHSKAAASREPRIAADTIALIRRMAIDNPRWGAERISPIVWACDFLQVYEVWFRLLFAFFVIDVHSKQVVHVAVTRELSERWVAQQLRNATPFGKGSKFIIRDRDAKFGVDFDRAAKGAGIRVLKTAVRAPLMNAICERFLGSVRRGCLDHIVILGERHLHIVLGEYAAYFNGSRPHQGLQQRVPAPQLEDGTVARGKVVALPVLGGLHHDYRRAA